MTEETRRALERAMAALEEAAIFTERECLVYANLHVREAAIQIEYALLAGKDGR